MGKTLNYQRYCGCPQTVSKTRVKSSRKSLGRSAFKGTNSVNIEWVLSGGAPTARSGPPAVAARVCTPHEYFFHPLGELTAQGQLAAFSVDDRGKREKKHISFKNLVFLCKK